MRNSVYTSNFIEAKSTIPTQVSGYAGSGEYKWDSGTIFRIKDLSTWEEYSMQYSGYELNLLTGQTREYTFYENYPGYPETSSSPVSTDGIEVYIDDSGLNFF